MKFTPRKLLFKAWNQETRLMMRLNSIECVKGELYRKDHILLQFTGFFDKHSQEIYEMDLVVIGNDQLVVVWDNLENRWALADFREGDSSRPFTRQTAETAMRVCSYFESERSPQVI